MMYRLRSLIDDSLTQTFECYEDMAAFVMAHGITDDDAVQEEWIDQRMIGIGEWSAIEVAEASFGLGRAS